MSPLASLKFVCGINFGQHNLLYLLMIDETNNHFNQIYMWCQLFVDGKLELYTLGMMYLIQSQLQNLYITIKGRTVIRWCLISKCRGGRESKVSFWAIISISNVPKHLRSFFLASKIQSKTLLRHLKIIRHIIGGRLLYF